MCGEKLFTTLLPLALKPTFHGGGVLAPTAAEEICPEEREASDTKCYHRE